jgi:hypothetical protein
MEQGRYPGRRPVGTRTARRAAEQGRQPALKCRSDSESIAIGEGHEDVIVFPTSLSVEQGCPFVRVVCTGNLAGINVEECERAVTVRASRLHVQELDTFALHRPDGVAEQGRDGPSESHRSLHRTADVVHVDRITVDVDGILDPKPGIGEVRQGDLFSPHRA